MGKFVVTGQHNAGKSAFIRSFVKKEQIEFLKPISQNIRSTRFITEYDFGRDVDLSFDVTFKDVDRVVKEVMLNYKRQLKINDPIEEDNEFDSLNGESGICSNETLEKERNARQEEEVALQKHLSDVQNLEGLYGKQMQELTYEEFEMLLGDIFDMGKTKFIDLNEFMPQLFDENDYVHNFWNRDELVRLKDKVFDAKGSITWKDISDIVRNTYAIVIEKIKHGKEKTVTYSERNEHTQYLSELLNKCVGEIKDTEEVPFVKVIKSLFRKPEKRRREKTNLYFSGIIEKIHAKVSLNEELFIDAEGRIKYDFMKSPSKLVDPKRVEFKLVDSFGLDHGAKDEGDGGVLYAYTSIITQSDIDGVILLGTVDSGVEDAQTNNQENVVVDIVNYNLSEKPGLNIMYVINQADKDREFIGESAIDIRKEEANGIKESIMKNRSAYFADLYAHFQKEYIDHSIENFLNSICFYSSADKEQFTETDRKAISQMNQETYEQIDRICRTYGRYNIQYTDTIDFFKENESLECNLKDYMCDLFNYIDCSIKLIASKYKINGVDDSDEYTEFAKCFRGKIWWNTAKALANLWNQKAYAFSNYTGAALWIRNYPEKMKENFSLDQKPQKILRDHLRAMFLYKCKKNEKKRMYPFEFYDGKYYYVFIQQCMYDAIDRYAESKGKVFITEKLTRFSDGKELDRYFIEGLSSQVKESANTGIDDNFLNGFKEVFLEVMEKKFNQCFRKAVEDELLDRLNGLVADDMKSSNPQNLVRSLVEMDGYNPDKYASLVNENDSEFLKNRLKEMIDQAFD